eukprot:3503699-Alexandrium_andersonii.AAC.1
MCSQATSEDRLALEGILERVRLPENYTDGHVANLHNYPTCVQVQHWFPSKCTHAETVGCA